jgi:hypothetical protein
MEADLNRKVVMLAFGVAVASAAFPACAADLPSRSAPPAPVAAEPNPLAPVVAIVTLPFTIVETVVHTLVAPPAPPVVVAKH